ncbi:MAG: hypothetical protein GXP55_00615 [Deltaproteobacteria bacterium]|nr:hypothetical protein [Deltaproteobacteria bacterium]
MGRRHACILLSLALGCVFLTQKGRADTPPNGHAMGSEELRREGTPEQDPYFDPMSVQGQRARGFYASGPYVRVKHMEGLVRSVRSADLDAVVIDLKDGAGRVTYDTEISILQPQVRNFLRDPRALVAGLKQAGIYTIARIVCFADPQLPRRSPERGIVHARRGTPWVSWGTGGTWLDPYNEENHQLVVQLAREAESFGFDEIQLDYVRFPVDEGTSYARFPAQDERSRAEVLVDLLREVDAAVHVPLGVDVFGLTAFRRGDRDGLGQDLEAFTRYVEVFTPMLYLNSMRSWHRGRPRRAYGLVRQGVSGLRERLGPRPVIRPFLQAFERGSENYGPGFIAEQIRGARWGGADGFLFWHPGSRYQVLRQAMRSSARGIGAFPLHGRDAQRAIPLANEDGREARRIPSSATSTPANK